MNDRERRSGDERRKDWCPEREACLREMRDMLAMHRKEVDESLERLKRDMREEVSATIRDSLSRLFLVDLSDETERREFIRRSRSRSAWDGLLNGAWRWLSPAIAAVLVGFMVTFVFDRADRRAHGSQPPAVHGSEKP